jgi:hypothetical protein
MELRVVKRWLDDNMEKGFIRPSKSSVASPILLAQKPGGGVRICVDYRGINNATIKSRYPIPLIKETLDSICKAKVFTKLDVIAAFNRVRVAEGKEWLTAFITRFGLYESLLRPIIFFLLDNAGTFLKFWLISCYSLSPRPPSNRQKVTARANAHALGIPVFRLVPVPTGTEIC